MSFTCEAKCFVATGCSRVKWSSVVGNHPGEDCSLSVGLWGFGGKCVSIQKVEDHSCVIQPWNVGNRYFIIGRWHLLVTFKIAVKVNEQEKYKRSPYCLTTPSKCGNKKPIKITQGNYIMKIGKLRMNVSLLCFTLNFRIYLFYCWYITNVGLPGWHSG